MKTSVLKTILLIAAICLHGMAILNAQNQITGKVWDAAEKPLAYASVVLLNAVDSSLIRGIFSSETGTYTFDALPAGMYLCSYSMVGFTTNYSKTFELNGNSGLEELETIVLKESAAALNEVQVTAKRPFLEQRIDRTVVNVANSITNAGSSALQVLQRSPGVQINALSNTISLAGKQGVVVMINGKISRLPEEALIQMLAGMNSDNIDRIELIHTPPANFEAQGNGGIINIVLKNTGDEGLNGGYSLKVGQGNGPKYGGGLHFNYRKKWFNLFGNYDHNYNLNPQLFTNYRGVKQGNNFLETETFSDRDHTPTTTQSARLGADFQLSPKTTIGVLGVFFDRNWYMKALNRVTYSRNGMLEEQANIPNTETNHSQSFTGNINLVQTFGKNQTLNFDADIIKYTYLNPSFYNIQNLNADGTMVSSEEELRIDKNTPIQVIVSKADYSLPIGKNTKVEAGGKFTSMRFDNDVRVDRREPGQDWQVIPEYSSLFHLNEDIAGVYGSVSGKVDEKTEFKAGLRFEYTDTNLSSEEQPDVVDRQYSSWFPSVFISRKLTEVQSLNMSYSRRISRPSLRRLAPYLIFSDPTTTDGGNPALQASFTDATRLDYSYKTWRFGLSYSIEHGVIRWVPVVDAVNNTQVGTYNNLENEKVASASISFPWKLLSWWESQNNFYVNNRQLNFIIEGHKFRNENVIWGFNLTQTIRMPNQFNLEISGNYESPGYWGISYWNAVGSLNIGLEKDFGNRWGKLRFSATDLFSSNENWVGETREPEIDLLVKSSYIMSERVFMLSWNNTFGNRKLKSARQRQTGSSDEMRRM
ncbi:MAG: outer membrane beta-barrel protein [Lewinellaceae bacterium]|nr:outer membrane beta-barrel protein [Saprospiraceae bacterium]MCB9345591.1 outer membrane beta-barrel protein [Lewinellaceae bacterium]